MRYGDCSCIALRHLRKRQISDHTIRKYTTPGQSLYETIYSASDVCTNVQVRALQDFTLAFCRVVGLDSDSLQKQILRIFIKVDVNV